MLSKNYFLVFLLTLFPLSGLLGLIGHGGLSLKLTNFNFFAIFVYLTARLLRGKKNER